MISLAEWMLLFQERICSKREHFISLLLIIIIMIILIIIMIGLLSYGV